MDAPSDSQKVCEQIVLLRHMLFLTPQGIIKETMYTPFAERTVLPTQLVLPDYLEGHRRSSILLQLYKSFLGPMFNIQFAEVDYSLRWRSCHQCFNDARRYRSHLLKRFIWCFLLRRFFSTMVYPTLPIST